MLARARLGNEGGKEGSEVASDLREQLDVVDDVYDDEHADEPLLPAEVADEMDDIAHQQVSERDVDVDLAHEAERTDGWGSVLPRVRKRSRTHSNERVGDPLAAAALIFFSFSFNL